MLIYYNKKKMGFCCSATNTEPMKNQTDMDIYQSFSIYHVERNVNLVWKKELGKKAQFANKEQVHSISLKALKRSNPAFNNNHFNDFKFDHEYNKIDEKKKQQVTQEQIVEMLKGMINQSYAHVGELSSQEMFVEDAKPK